MDGLNMRLALRAGRTLFREARVMPRPRPSPYSGFRARCRCAPDVISIFLDSRQRNFRESASRRMMSVEGKGRPVYDRIARHYERAMRPLERLGLKRMRARVLAEMPEGARVLEVGAGTG